MNNIPGVLNLHIHSTEKKLKCCDFVLIHVPKTGGSTLHKILKKVNHRFLTLHLLDNYSLTAIMLGLIMKSDKKIIVTWRDPKQYYSSFYNFFKKYKNVKLPDNYQEFISNYNNLQVSYITKSKYLEDKAEEEDYLKVIELIKRPNTLFFLGDRFQESLDKVKDFLEIELDLNTTVERFNWDKPRLLTTSGSSNELDQRVYNEVIEYFDYTKNENKETRQKDNIILVNTKDIPWYFPANQYLPDYEEEEDSLKEVHQTIIKSINSEVVSITEYLQLWYKHYPQYSNIVLQY